MENPQKNKTNIKDSSLKALRDIVFISALGGLLFGYDSSVTNGSLIFMALPNQLNLSPLDEGLVTSALLFGAIFGSLATGPIADKYGRKKCILFMASILFFFRFGCVFAVNAEMMIVFRFILGLAIGGISVAVPMYLAEISSSENRGQFIALYGLMVVTGQFLAFFVNALLGNLFGFMDNIWRYIIAVAFCPAIILLLGIIRMPESPRWLISNGHFEQAFLILKKIRPSTVAEKEFNDIKTLVKSEANLKQANFKEFLTTPWIRRLLFIGIAIAIIQQITGVNAINYYGTKILHESGFNLNAALIANTANGIVSILATFIGMYYLKKIGRRKIFLIGLSFTTISEILISFFTFTISEQDYYGYIIFSLILLFMAFQQGCSGLVIWILMSELFPLRLRGVGVGIITFISWIANFMVGLGFPPLIDNIGIAMTFLLFALCGVISFLIILKYCPETKGRTLEELEKMFRNYKSHHHKYQYQ